MLFVTFASVMIILEMCGVSLGSLVSIIDLKNITLLTDRIECPHCSLLKCDQYCYIVKHGFRGHTDSQQCTDEDALVSLIRERLLTNITNDACQRSTANEDDAICWCRKPGDRSRKTQEGNLKDIRLWRYKSVIWQRDQIMRLVSSSPTFRPCSVVFLIIPLLAIVTWYPFF
ncbi:hypothetical protein QR680_000722 [Steinernema hermaphroditum]|uniref:Uncharacterized protein n=1 Tax=Steinernema hermaphroditum TaxID=289476 RepID=A0AA39LEP6_9BILA|nr:hypothetical protein QR680_000722 [Steinernema hermaphroditum]